MARLEVIYRDTGNLSTPTAIKGSIKDFCQKLHQELLTSGYSLLDEDVEQIALDSVEKLAGWCRLECQFIERASATSPTLPNPSSPSFMDLTLDTQLLLDEWVIVEPVIRCHCDLFQAKRMEGSQSLGLQPFAISVSEAQSNHTQALETMKREAFCHEPFSVIWD